VEQNILYQDNKSTMLLAKNGRWSSSKRTKHIKSRYFFIKDKIDKGEVQVEHKPTEKMWSDIFTKPKQGTGFRRDRAYLMNVPEDYDDDLERSKTNEKLLGKQVIASQHLKSAINTMIAKNNPLPQHHCRSELEREMGTGRSIGGGSQTAHGGHSTGRKLASSGWHRGMVHMGRRVIV
jgi:hypothetical protein